MRNLRVKEINKSLTKLVLSSALFASALTPLRRKNILADPILKSQDFAPTHTAKYYH
jgi:hypothetical protein